jgi:hypothetical protein
MIPQDELTKVAGLLEKMKTTYTAGGKANPELE